MTYVLPYPIMRREVDRQRQTHDVIETKLPTAEWLTFQSTWHREYYMKIGPPRRRVETQPRAFERGEHIIIRREPNLSVGQKGSSHTHQKLTKKRRPAAN
jgi:hypothetical protein